MDGKQAAEVGTQGGEPGTGGYGEEGGGRAVVTFDLINRKRGLDRLETISTEMLSVLSCEHFMNKNASNCLLHTIKRPLIYCDI